MPKETTDEALQGDDAYETLQLHPNAHPLLVVRAFRILVAIYHPDNKQTGDRAMFERLVAAHRVLSDPIRRAAYDRAHGHAGVPVGVASAIDESPEPRTVDESRLRLLILATLYSSRRSHPTRPGLPLRVLLDMTDTEHDQLQFSLWYLRGKKLIELVDDDSVAITVTGVDYLEETSTVSPEELLLVPGGRRLPGRSTT